MSSALSHFFKNLRGPEMVSEGSPQFSRAEGPTLHGAELSPEETERVEFAE